MGTFGNLGKIELRTAWANEAGDLGSGIPVERFIDHIFQARAITQERTASITKMTEGSEYEVERKTKMAYFFAVLEDHIRLSGNRPARAGADASV